MRNRDERWTTVLKVGGACLSRGEDLAALARHVGAIKRRGRDVVVVHGGGPEIGALHEALGVPFEKRGGLRVTSEASMSLVTMVLCGQVNTTVVAHLSRARIPAGGVTGADCAMMRSELLDPSTLGRVGGAPEVDAAPIERLLRDGVVAVVAPVCLGSDDALVNVNADVVAQSVAVALGADTLDFVSDVPGVSTGDRVAKKLRPAEVAVLVESSVIEGGMVPKIAAALAAIDGGVGRVRVGDLASLEGRTATEVTA